MNPTYTGQVPPPPPQGFRLPNGQVLPQGARIVTPNNGQGPTQMSGGNVHGHGAHSSVRPWKPARIISETHRRPRTRRRGRGARSPSPSGSSSPSSVTLFSDFDSDSEPSTIITEPSASGSLRGTKASHHRHNDIDAARSSSKHNRSSKRRIPRYITEPANFGERHATRRHSLDAPAGLETAYLVTRDGQRVQVSAAAAAAPAGPRETGTAAIPADNLAHIDAYRLGRADQRAEAEVDEDLHSGTRRYRPASPAPPRYEGRPGPVRTEIHQREYDWERDQLPRIRRVMRSEVDRQRERDLDADFAGLRIGREARSEDERDDLYHRAQKRREARALDAQEEIMREMEEEQEPRWRETRPSFRSSFGFMPQGRSGGPFGRP